MNRRLCGFIATCALGLSAFAAEPVVEPEVWTDKDAIFVKMKGPRAVDAQAVRNQGAGVLDALLAKPLLPLEFGRTTVSGLPGFYMRGILLAEPESKAVLAFALFAEGETFIGIVTSPEDVDFGYVETHSKVSGASNPSAGDVLEDIVQRLQASLPEIKRDAIARNRDAFEKFRTEIRKGDAAVDVVKARRGDLATSETNAEALNRRLRALNPPRIYGWGSKRLSDIEQSVTFIYELKGKTTTLVWMVNTADGTATNITAEAVRVDVLRANRRLNLPSDRRLMTYRPEFDLTSFKNSDYYRGRGTDPLGNAVE